MALKISVTLPDGTAVVLESEEPDSYSSLATMVLRELKTQGVTAPVTLASGTPSAAPFEASSKTSGLGRAAQEQREEGGGGTLDLRAHAGWDEFQRFCMRANPLGDMRRVVVAAEAARLYLGMEAVSPRELTAIFETLGWTMPASFVQALRNAARSIFRWLERVPGRRSYYIVTSKGRDVVLGEDVSSFP